MFEVRGEASYDPELSGGGEAPSHLPEDPVCLCPWLHEDSQELARQNSNYVAFTRVDEEKSQGSFAVCRYLLSSALIEPLKSTLPYLDGPLIRFTSIELSKNGKMSNFVFRISGFL